MKPALHSSRITGLSLTALFSLTIASQSAIIVNDTFSDNERATQNEPSSLEWAFAPNGGGNTSANLSAATGALVYTPQAAAAAQHSSAYFTATSLAVGETIILSFDMTFSGTPGAGNDGLRFGLFNSYASPLTSPFAATLQSFLNAAEYETYTGYFATANVGAATGTSTFQTREGNASASNTTPFGGSSGVGTANTAAYLGLAAGTAYNTTLSITRSTATSAFVSSTINGVTVSGTDVTSTAATTTFDTIFILTGSAAVPTTTSFTIDNVNVSVIPEPGTAILGVLGLLALMRRRR